MSTVQATNLKHGSSVTNNIVLDASGNTTVSGNATVSGTLQANGVTGSVYPLVQGTAQASTSGTSIDFTGVPSWVKRITVVFNGVSTGGTSIPLIRLGTASGIEATGYAGSGIQLVDATSVNAATETTGFQIRSALAANTNSGAVQILNVSGNIWVAFGTLTDSSRAAGYVVGGTKTLAAVLDRVRITTVGGTDAFDAGSINILYE